MLRLHWDLVMASVCIVHLTFHLAFAQRDGGWVSYMGVAVTVAVFVFYLAVIRWRLPSRDRWKDYFDD